MIVEVAGKIRTLDKVFHYKSTWWRLPQDLLKDRSENSRIDAAVENCKHVSVIYFPGWQIHFVICINYRQFPVVIRKFFRLKLHISRYNGPSAATCSGGGSCCSCD